ncbi:MAG: hypothetical protein IKL00_05050 [Oscillospiraceae bacterium]|nr:hypothetical protein [Oscillospiraceae bacterium]
MNYKKIRIFAAALTFAVLLTGCNRYGTDMSKEYKEFLDYTFNGSYSVELTEEGVINEDTDHEQGYRYWDVTYTDKFGEQHTVQMTGAQLSKAKKEYFKTQEWYDTFEMAAFTRTQVSDIAKQQFADEVLSKYFDGEFEESGFRYVGEEYQIMFSPMAPQYGFNEMGYKIATQEISAKDGYKISECDLSTLAQNDEYTFMIYISLEPDADAADYDEIAHKVEQDFLEYTNGRCNYQFVYRQYKNEMHNESETFYKHTVFLGEEFVPDSSIEGDNFLKAVFRYIEKKYQ